MKKFVLCLLTVLTVTVCKNSSADSTPFSYKINNVTITCMQGDITKQQVDIIVNAANKELQAGSGVCGAIFKAAGKDALQEACNSIPAQKNGIRCPTGTACITPSFNLQTYGITHIIHAVGPDCRIIKDSKEQDKLLKEAYLHSLELATEKKAQSIAFPFISSAIYAFPKERAATSALKTIIDFAKTQATTLTHIYFILFSSEDLELFKKVFSKQSCKY